MVAFESRYSSGTLRAREVWRHTANSSSSFRSVSVRLPPTLHGFDTASVVIWGNLALTDIQSSQADALRTCKVELRTSHGRSDIAKRQDAGQESDVIEYANEKLALPVKRRYSSPLIISFNDSHFGIRQKPIAEAVIWLMDIPDHSRKRIQVPGKLGYNSSFPSTCL